MGALIEYLEQYALLSLEKQEKFARLVGEHSMEKDLDAGLVRFSDGLELPFQVLGTESDNSLTWLWAWAEEQTEIPAELIRSSLQMKEWGAGKDISECSIPSVDLNKADGNMISMVGAEVCKASCYYRDVYEGGALFLLLFGQIVDRQQSFDIDGLSRQFARLISMYQLNYRKVFLSYFQLKGLSFSEKGRIIAGELETGEEVRAEFDQNGGVKINGKPVTD